jgi:hypothetical protein
MKGYRGRCNRSSPCGVWRKGGKEPLALTIKHFGLTLGLLLILANGAAAQTQNTSQDLINLQQEQVNKATKNIEELRQLVSEGLIARMELEKAEQTVASLQDQLAATQQQIKDSERLAEQIREQEKLASSKPQPILGASRVTPTSLRYGGIGGWSLTGLSAIQSFFLGQFGRILPTSAIGQSATHNQLGWDHRNAVDIPLHPDSTEGRALISYLQSSRIPFTAFRAAIPGVATGPHIHVGLPSHRLA